MGTINNPHFYSTTSGTTPTTWITDDIDYPHSGLIKALSQGIRGNYAIKGSATDFDITLASSTYTTIVVLTGKAYRDGKLVTISQLNTTNLTGVHATEDVYQLLVAQADNTMALRGSNSVTNRLPNLTDGDIPIAVIKLVAGSAQGSAGTSDRLVQFLTTSKVSNDLSIGYDNSGYTETANIVGASGVTTITAASSTDVKVKLAGTAAGDTFEVIDSAAEVQFKVQGDGEVSTQGNITVGGNIIKASDGGSAITLDTSDNVTIGNNLKVGGNIIQASDGGNTITLDTSDNVTIGNNLKVGGNVIQASDGGSTITMDTSDNVTIAGDLTLHGGGSGADINLHNGGNATIEVGTTAAGTAGRDLTISAGTAATASSNDTDGGDLILNAGGGDGTGTSIMKFSTKVSGTDAVTERMRIDTDGQVKIKSLGVGTAAELQITESSDDITIKNTVSDKDIIFNVNDGGVDTESMRIDGDINQVKIKSLGIGTAAELTITESSDDIYITNTVSDKDIIFRVNDGGSADQPLMRLHGAAQKVRITSQVDGALNGPKLELFRDTADASDADILGLLSFIGEDGGNSETEYARIESTIVAESAGGERGSLELSVAASGGGVLKSGILIKPTEITFNDDSITTDVRIEGNGDANLLFTDASTDKVGIGTNAPANKLQVSHSGSDGSDGLMIVREDGTTTDGEILGGIGFDARDGNVPSSVTEAAAFITSYATEDHTTTDKGGNLKFGVSLIDEDDDTVSTIVANVGPPDTTSNATTYAGLNSRATTAIVAAATYAPTVGDSGTLVIFEHANSNLTLPSINNATSVGVQFTVFNETGSTISAQIAVSNSATINGGAASALDDIESYKAATFVCSGNNTWIRIG